MAQSETPELTQPVPADLGTIVSQTYALYLLEEIRTLLGQNLQVSARIYDQLAGHNVNGAPDDEQTWKQAFKDIVASRKRLREIREQLEGKPS